MIKRQFFFYTWHVAQQSHILTMTILEFSLGESYPNEIYLGLRTYLASNMGFFLDISKVMKWIFFFKFIFFEYAFD